MQPTVLISFALALVALIPSALGKQCLYTFDDNTKSIVVWDSYVQDYNVCSYWNWHYFNLPGFTDAIPWIYQVCHKPDIKEIGFVLFSPLDVSPDLIFMPGGECGFVQAVNMFEFVTASGWTCAWVGDVATQCAQQGPPIYGY
ncbi:hypothetical protein HDU96_001850 [Phlyctochytrium bullatum]|nr:hypothetical protein HDU96_001850 [Phlyctochytrium bullatum]